MIQFYSESVVDSVVWIGAFSGNDQYKEASKSIFEAFTEGKIKKVYVTDYIILETVNYLLRKEEFDTAFLVFELFLKSNNLEIIYVDNLILGDVKEIFERYKDLSLTDCSIIALMKEKNIKYLFSFDSGFDKVKGLIRRENV